MIDEKLLLEALNQREEKHNADYDEFDDCLEAQFIVAHHLQELKEIREIVQMQPIVERNNVLFKKCVYCGKSYQTTKNSVKYCNKCRENNIPEKLKNRGNDARQLRGKIYKRLESRSGHREYCLGINDERSFSIQALEYKKNHTPDEYYEWLKEIEKLTK